MKVLTLRLGQFTLVALCLTVVFRYALNLCIGMNSVIGSLLCSVVYFGQMFLTGWYFGSKDVAENEIHDIGFRYHFVTYILCIGLGYATYYIGWHCESLKSLTITAISWGIGLFIHFIFFLFEQKKTIKGYARDEIFQ